MDKSIEFKGGSDAGKNKNMFGNGACGGRLELNADGFILEGFTAICGGNYE